MRLTKDLAKSSLSILASQITSTIISIAFIAYFARVFSKEQMALYATLSMLSGWTSLIGGMGMGTLLEKNVAQLEAIGEKIQAKQLISSVILYRTVVMIVISTILFLSSHVISINFFGSNEFDDLISYIVIISFFMAFSGSLGVVQVSCQRFVSQSVIGVVGILFQRTLCVAGYLFTGIYGFFTGYLLAVLIGIILCIFDIRHYLNFNFISFNKVFRESKAYFGLVALKGATDQIDRPLIAVFLGAETLAGYHVAKRLYENFYGLFMAFVSPASIKFGEARGNGTNDLNNYYKSIITVLNHIFIPLAFFLMVISKSLLLLYSGEKYVGSFLVLIAFDFTLIGVVTWTVVRQAALRLISARYLAVQYIVTSVTTFIFYVILLPTFGDVGIPLSIGIGYIIGSIPIVRQLKSQWNLIYPLKKLIYSTGCGICVLMTILPASILSPGIYQIMFEILLYAFIYFSWLNLFGPDEVRNIFKHADGKIPACAEN